MKILCSKEEYTALIKNCVLNQFEGSCDKCVIMLASDKCEEECNDDFLEEICEIHTEDG